MAKSRGAMRALPITALAGLAGCVDSFQGSNVQVDFSPYLPVQASPGAMPELGELPGNVHFTLYAFEDGIDAQGNPVGRLFAVQQFEIHRIVDLASPCFIDVGEHVPFPGLHVSQYAQMIAKQTGISDLANPPASATEAQKIAAATAVQRMADIAALGGDTGLKVVSGASDASYPDVAVDCTSPGIPPADCTTSEANHRRLVACQAFWHDNREYFEGTDRVLTEPLAGTTHGMVDGLDPINLAPVGGAQFYVTTDLGGVGGYAIYYQIDGMPDPGELLLYGNAATPTRGVTRVHMTSVRSPSLTADVAIFANVDEDDTGF